MDQHEILKRTSIINVKNKLGLEERYAKGDNIYVYCPFCGGERQSYMKLNVKKDSYYCRMCGENGYAIGLYAREKYISGKEAYKILINQEADMTTELKDMKKSERKEEYEISFVYECFLKMLRLTKRHYNILTQLGFSREDIIRYSFKSIPQNESEKIEICNRLMENGIDIKGIPRILSQ